MPLSTEYKQGQKDYRNGYGFDDCPYNDEAKAAEWVNGWYRASGTPTLH